VIGRCGACDTSGFSGHCSGLTARAPAELEQQPQVVADGAVMGDLAIRDPEDVHLFVADSLAGRFDAIERSDLLAGHGGRGHHHAFFGSSLRNSLV